MEKILFYSDIHFNLYREFSDGEGGCLDRILEVQRAIINYAVEHGIRHLVFLGDWFHNRSNLNVMVLQKSLELMYQTLRMDIKFYFLVGNHDQYDSKGTYHSLYPFKLLGVVVDAPGYVNVGGRVIGFIPYHVGRDQFMQNVESLVDYEPLSVLCLHQGVKEAELPNGMKAWDEQFLSVRDLPSHLPIVSGHIHRTQLVENLLYVGAPLQHSFGDSGDHRGWYVMDEDGEFEFVENTFSPRFHKLEMREGVCSFPTEFTTEDYFWITTDGDVNAVRQDFLDKGFRHLRIDSFPKQMSMSERCVQKDQSFEQMVDAYVDGTLADENERGVIKKYGKEVLKRVTHQ
jgi:DNA repair exonuclease SbcCD nuclease subunit